MTLMKSVSVPLYHMITRWVLHGELLDPQHEFFVAKSISPDTGGRGGARASSRSQFNISADFLWHHYYQLNLAMLPSFISSKLAYKILVVGKSINFMKACMQHGGRDEQVRGGKKDKKKGAKGKLEGNLPVITMREALGEVVDQEVEESKAEGDLVNDVGSTDLTSSVTPLEVGVKVSAEVLQQGGDDEQEVDEEDYSDSAILLSEDFEASLRSVCHTYGDEVALSAQVHAIAEVIETRLLKMVLKKFNLFTHLAALKKFMLLGQASVTCSSFTLFSYFNVYMRVNDGYRVIS